MRDVGLSPHLCFWGWGGVVFFKGNFIFFFFGGGVCFVVEVY